MPDYIAIKSTGELEKVTLTAPEAFRPTEGGGEYTIHQLNTAHAVTITGSGDVAGPQTGTSYLFEKSTGELEVILGTPPFTAVPAAGAGAYDVWELGAGSDVTVAAPQEAYVEGDTTAPLINEFSIGAPTGTDYPITLDITEADSLPVTAYIGAYLTSGTALTDQEVIDGMGVGFGSFSTSVDVVDEPVDLGSLAAGDYTAKVVVVDSAGNSSSATDTFTVDSVAPAVTDDFNRADERLINGPNWSRIFRTSGYVAISGNVAQAEDPNDFEAVRYDIPVDSDDHFAEVETTISVTGDDDLVRVFASVVSLTEYYSVEINGDGRFRMRVRDSSGERVLQTVTGLTLVPNGVLRIEVEDVAGNQTIRGFYNGVEIHSEINSDLPVARYCGFSIKAVQTSNIQVDNYTQGSL